MGPPMISIRLALAAVVVVSGICSATNFAQPATAPVATPATRPAEFDALAEQLGSPDARTRDAAQAKIVKLGNAALKPVEELAETAADPEVKARAEAILRQIP